MYVGHITKKINMYRYIPCIMVIQYKFLDNTNKYIDKNKFNTITNYVAKYE